MEHLPPSSSVGPQPFSEVGLVSGFDARIYGRTHKTVFKLSVSDQVYECWSARPLRRLPENGKQYRVQGYSLGGEVHVVSILRIDGLAYAAP
jgi:hypothetical protein